ncbi:MAG TPA: glycosyltransferase family 39 protein [Thermomicrobiales bacterium]|nr:glycosyltransferase family 39 protein [Thermomicrobiales bacterium]
MRTARRPAIWDGGAPTTWVWLTFLSFLSLVLHLPFFGLPMISDEGGYAYVAQRWFDGRGDLYHNIWVSRPQGIFVAYGLIFHTLGTSTEAIRIGAWLISIATMLFVWLFARDWAGRRAAMTATLLFAIISGSPAIEGFTANAEVFMALPAAAGAWLLLRAGRRGWDTRSLFVCGALASIATQLKPSGVMMIPVFFAYVWFVGGSGRVMLQRWSWITAGVVISAAPAFIGGWMTGWHDFVFAAITYRLEFQSSTTVGLHHHIAALTSLLIRFWPVLVLMTAVMILHFRQTRRWSDVYQWADRLLGTTRLGIIARPILVLPRPVPRADGDVMLRLWMLGSLAGIAMGGDWWYHYFVQIIAPFVIWFGVLLLDVARFLSRRRRTVLALAVLLVFVAPYGVLRHGNAGAVSESIFNHTGYPTQAKVAEYIRDHTPREAPIFVAFDQAAIYYLADRPSTYRYMYDQELRAIPNAETDLVAMVESPSRPLYIIGTKQRAPFPDRGQAFWNEVSEYYHLETMVHGVPIYKADTRRPMLLSDQIG